MSKCLNVTDWKTTTRRNTITCNRCPRHVRFSHRRHAKESEDTPLAAGVSYTSWHFALWTRQWDKVLTRLVGVCRSSRPQKQSCSSHIYNCYCVLNVLLIESSLHLKRFLNSGSFRNWNKSCAIHHKTSLWQSSTNNKSHYLLLLCSLRQVCE